MGYKKKQNVKKEVSEYMSKLGKMGWKARVKKIGKIKKAVNQPKIGK